MRNNKLIIFLSALAALYLMTVLSALLGWVVTTFIPREITYYTCTAIMFLFGLKMLWEAWRMKEDEAQETQREVAAELGVAAETNPGDEGVSCLSSLLLLNLISFSGERPDQPWPRHGERQRGPADWLRRLRTGQLPQDSHPGQETGGGAGGGAGGPTDRSGQEAEGLQN